MNPIRIVHHSPNDPDCLERHASVPIAFWVNSRLVVRPVENGLGALFLQEEAASAIACSPRRRTGHERAAVAR